MKNRKLLFLASLFLFTSSANAITVQGVISDVIHGNLLQNVIVKNLSRPQKTTSNSKGVYTLSVQYGDELLFELSGYVSKRVKIDDNQVYQFKNIQLDLKNVLIDTVVITPGLTDYQKDSLANREIFGKKVEQKQAKFKLAKEQRSGVFTFDDPISAPYQKFSKKYRRLRAFQKRYKNEEQDLFVQTRYNISLISEVTKLNDESARAFLLNNPMPYDYARAASNLEIKMWIMFRFKSEYQHQKNDQ